MRKLLLTLCIAGLLQSVASAALVGSWAKTVSGENTIYTLTVTPNAGETMYGFDIGVFDTAAGSATWGDTGGGVMGPIYADAGNWVNNGNALNTTADQAKYTSFLLTTSQIPVVISFLSGADSSDLHIAGATSGAGWANPLALLHIIVPTSGATYVVNPTTKALSGVTLWKGDEGSQIGASPAVITVGADRHQVPLVGPEPGTFALLGIGAIGLVAYRWLQRRAA